MEYLKLNLENKTAIVRVKDEIEYGDTLIVQAHFNEAGVTLEWIRSDKKPKSHGMDNESMDLLATAWLDFRGQCLQYEAEKVQAHEAAIKQAKELAASVKFDLGGLNIQLSHDKTDNSWLISIPETDYGMWTFSGEIEQLPARIQEALDYLKKKVEDAETHKHLHPDWQKIVDSYRRVFPLEPAEITEARALLKESGLTGWKIETGVPSGANVWSFYGPFGEGGDIYMPDETPDRLLADIKEYLERKKTDVILDAMDKIDEQAAQLLDASPDYHAWKLDELPDGYVLTVSGKTIFEHIPAEQLLDHIRQYVNMRILELARD